MTNFSSFKGKIIDDLNEKLSNAESKNQSNVAYSGFLSTEISGLKEELREAHDRIKELDKKLTETECQLITATNLNSTLNTNLNEAGKL